MKPISYIKRYQAPKRDAHRCVGPKSINAFTFIELMVALSVLSILVLIGYPIANSLYTRMSLESSADHLYHALNFARSQAIASQQVVNLCPSRDGNTCSDDWSEGYMVFYGEQSRDRPVTVLRSQHFKLKRATLVLSAFPENQHFIFLPTGMSQQGNGTFTWCIQEGTIAFRRLVVVSKTGRVRIQPGEATTVC